MPSNDRLLLAQLDVSVRRLERSMRKAGVVVDQTSNKMERKWNRAAANMERRMNQATRNIAVAIAAIGVTVAGREVAKFADTFIDLQNKIAAASTVSGIQADSLDMLQEAARGARAEFEGYVDLYSRILRAGDQVGATQTEVARATELTAKAFSAGGASAQEQAAGILQLGQALGSGFLQGDELRSIRENAPLIAKAIADEFDTTIGGLRELGAQGKLTSDRVFKALLEGSDLIEEAFGATTPRATEEAARAIDNLRLRIGAWAQETGAVRNTANGFADAINFVADNVGAFADALIIATAAVAGLLGAQGLVAISAAFNGVAVGATTAAKAMAVLRAASAFLLGPAGFVIALGAAAAGVAALVLNMDKLPGITSRVNSALRDTNELLEQTAEYAEPGGPIANLRTSFEGALEPINDIVEGMAALNQELARSGFLKAAQDAAALATQIDENNQLIDETIARISELEKGSFVPGTTPGSSGFTLVDEVALKRAKDELGELTGRNLLLEFRLGQVKQQGEQFGAEAAKAFRDRITPSERGTPTGETDEEKKKRQAEFNLLLDGTLARYEEQLAVLRETEAQRKALAEYEYDTELELARLSGQDEWIKRLEREAAIRERIAALANAGITGDAARLRAEEEQGAVDEATKTAEKRKAIQDEREAFREVFSGAVEEAIRSGNVGGAIKQVFADRAAEGLRNALDNLADVIFNLFKNIDFGAGGIGDIFGGIASLFGGKKAMGGPVRGNRLYQVGEGNRPELLSANGRSYLIPGEKGMVTPLKGMGLAPAGGGNGSVIAPQLIVQGNVTEDVLPVLQDMMARQTSDILRQVPGISRATRIKDASRGRA